MDILSRVRHRTRIDSIDGPLPDFEKGFLTPGRSRIFAIGSIQASRARHAKNVKRTGSPGSIRLLFQPGHEPRVRLAAVRRLDLEQPSQHLGEIRIGCIVETGPGPADLLAHRRLPVHDHPHGLSHSPRSPHLALNHPVVVGNKMPADALICHHGIVTPHEFA